MRYAKTFKQYSTLLLASVLGSLVLLLGACAEMTTPTPASANSNALAATTKPAGPAPTFAQAAATTASTPAQAATATIAVAPTLAPTTLAATATVAVAPTLTPVPPTATSLPPTATNIPPAAKTVPTAGPADSKSDGLGVSILAVNGNVRGKAASVVIQTAPRVQCKIAYTTPNGQPGTAKGLEVQTSDLNGRITWNWTIAANTTVGKGSVKVTCGDSSETKPITIG